MKSLNTKLFVLVLIFSSILSVGIFAGADTSGVNIPAPSCVVLNHGLFLGSGDYATANEVTMLQEFLASQGYFNLSATGYFGPITLNAVKNFQRDHNITAIGLVGPLTRAEIQRISCGVVSNTLHINSLSPTSGVVGTSVTIYGSGFTSDNTVYFGGGVILHVPSESGSSLAFTVPNTLNPSCFYSIPQCEMASRLVSPGSYDVDVQNSNGVSNVITFTVTSNQSASPTISSLSPTSGDVNTSVTIYGSGFTSSNTVTFGGNSIGSFSSNGGSSITFTVPQSLSPNCPPGSMCPMYMRLVTPGDYNVVVSNTNGSSNAATFTVTSGEVSSSLSITGLDAPSQLTVGQSGTWTLHATDSSGGSDLSYSVDWGDQTSNPYPMNASQATVNQSSSFTHTYNSPGTFVPTFTVTNNAGMSDSTGASVLVTN